MIKFLKQKNKGSSLLEMVFYLALFSLTSVLVINAILTMLTSFREVSINKDLSSGAKILEIISREVRNSQSLQITENQNPFLRSLTLNGLDDLGNPRIIRIDFANNDVSLYEDGVLVGNLNSDNIIVNNLNFEIIDFIREGDYDAVETFDEVSTTLKIYLELQSNRFNSTKTVDFTTSIIAREGY